MKNEGEQKVDHFYLIAERSTNRSQRFLLRSGSDDNLPRAKFAFAKQLFCLFSMKAFTAPVGYS